MARNWQFLLLAGALISPVGGWADKVDKIDREKQRQERPSRERVWDDNRGQSCPGMVCAAEGLTRVWEGISYGRGYPLDSEKEWRKEKEREKDRRESAR